MASSANQKRAESKIPEYNLSNRNTASTSAPKITINAKKFKRAVSLNDRQKPLALPTISEPVAGPLRRGPLDSSTPSAAAVKLCRPQNEGFGIKPPLHRLQSEPVRPSTSKNALSKPTTTSRLPINFFNRC